MNAASVLKVHCIVTHLDETTLEVCLEKLRAQTYPLAKIDVVSGMAPACNAFNRALELARDADILVHLAADVLLHPFAVEHLLRAFNRKRHYAVIGTGFDIFNGAQAPIGLWALNMRAVGEHRFTDTYKMDLDFCGRVEAATGLRRKTLTGKALGYHHPIWTPRELHTKFRYNAAKYTSKILRRYRDVLDRALAQNPGNATLEIGRLALMRGWAEQGGAGSPDHARFTHEFDELAVLYKLSGKEFFAYHADMIALAQRMLASDQPLTPMAGGFFTGEAATARTSWRVLLRPKFYRARLRTMAVPLYRAAPDWMKDIARLIVGRPPLNRTLRRWMVIGKPIGNYGESNQGIAAWEARWNAAPRDKRVLMVAPKDFAGSMYKWAEALNRYTDVAARLITFETHQYGYAVDLVVPEANACRRAAVLALAEQAGTLHLKDEHSWFIDQPNFTNLPLLKALFFSERFAGTRKIFTHYGGYARKFKADPAYIAAVQKFDARIAMTPDLNYPWFNGEYIPHTIDVDTMPFKWTDSHILGHSPSSPEKKGTYMLDEALILFGKNPPRGWQDWKLDLIHGVSHAACMLRKQEATLFFDQAGRHRVADLGIDDVIGWYGNSAIEAMAYGIPTIAHMSDDAFARSQLAGIDLSDIPVINMERSRDGLMAAIRGFVEATPEARRALAQRTRQFTVDFHGYEAVAKRLAQCYERVQTTITPTERAA